MAFTHKTKLKLDKEVGGGDLSKLCTITMLIVYPYAWTINFEICIQEHQPPIPITFQAEAWSHWYIGYWDGKTEGSPIGFVSIFEDWRAEKVPGQKRPISNLWEYFFVPEHRMPIWLLVGSDSSKLIETKIHENAIFVTRIAPSRAFFFLSSEGFSPKTL